MDIKNDDLAIALPLILYGKYIPMPKVRTVDEAPDYWVAGSKNEGNGNVLLRGDLFDQSANEIKAALPKLGTKVNAEPKMLMAAVIEEFQRQTLFLAPTPASLDGPTEETKISAVPAASLLMKNDAIFLRPDDLEDWLALN